MLPLLYINDICIASNTFNFRLFEDDTTILIIHWDTKFLYRQVNSGLNKLQYWFSLDKLSMNINKTNYTLVSNKQEKQY